jgi:hypothetical protein
MAPSHVCMDDFEDAEHVTLSTTRRFPEKKQEHFHTDCTGAWLTARPRTVSLPYVNCIKRSESNAKTVEY